MKIRKMLSNNKNHYGYGNPCNYITIHETGNTSKGAGAENHAKYVNNGSPSTYHYVVDDKEIIQLFNDGIQCWHAGDRKGNTQSIGIEMCVNSDGDFSKTVNNTVELVRYLMDKHNIPISNVVQHNKWSGKNCPANLRSGAKGITWNTFKEFVKGSKPSKKPSVNIDKLVKDTIAGKYGNGSERKKKLGDYYDEVQKRVNEQLNGKKPNSKPSVNIDKLVQDTIAGKYGNGNERKRRLGKHYDEVQKRINKILQ